MIDDRGIRPLKQGGISPLELYQRFFQIPSIDIQHLVQLPLDHIPAAVQAQVFPAWPHIDKTNVIVAVWRRKSPGPASRLHGMEDPDLFPFLHCL